ncbi:MAG: apolipoprotein N-acyltransferase [Deltaproteobacteria bacterium]|nr:apolipoprotein N-acyltransferase [Deltaproteobacteria bacterium]
MPASKSSNPLDSAVIRRLLGAAGPQSLAGGLILAALGGAAQAVAWPKLNVWFLTFLGPVFLWRAIYGQKPKRAFLLGWVYGLALGFFSVSWLGGVMSGYGGLGAIGGTVILLILVAYLALYQAIWALFAAPLTVRPPIMDGRIISPALWAAILWTGLDFLKNTIFTGFNWTPLAGGLAAVPILIGGADLVGIYGLTLWVALTAFLAASATVYFPHPKAALIKFIVALLLLGAQIGYGKVTFDHYEGERTKAQIRNIAVLQPSIPQDRKWNPTFRKEILDRFVWLLKKSAAENPWLTVWSETAAPFLYGWDQVETVWLDRIIDQAGGEGRSMLVGVAAFEYDENGSLKLHNRAWLTGPDGTLGRYDKTHLVPFGEYVPLAETLPFLKYPFMQGLLGAAGTYSPGSGPTRLVIDQIPFGVLICFESIFPYQARDKVKLGSEFLVVTTNDSWFGLTAAPAQHLLHSVIRAVETRRPLVRAANNGMSALIAPSGLILNSSKLNDVDAYLFPMPLPAEPKTTLFVRGGHYLAPSCALVTACYAFYRFLKHRRSRSNKASGRSLAKR